MLQSPGMGARITDTTQHDPGAHGGRPGCPRADGDGVRGRGGRGQIRGRDEGGREDREHAPLRVPPSVGICRRASTTGSGSALWSLSPGRTELSVVTLLRLRIKPLLWNLLIIQFEVFLTHDPVIN